MPDDNTKDLSPDGLNVYGYCVVYKRDGDSKWMIDQCDEYQNLPAHYPFQAEALERARFLRQRNIECRVAALLAEATDTPEDFERNKINEENAN